MKHLLLVILTFLSVNVGAQQQVNSVWAFNIANTQGTYYRAILEEANRIQKKYNFVPEHKPGAGGSIGAAYVLSQDRLALLGTATAFFVRPNLYSTNNYRFDQFRPVHVMAFSPVALTTKSKTLREILAQDRISIGTAGPGTGTHLYALKFKEYYPGKNIVVVPYKSSTEALQDVLGGHIDLTFEFLGDAEAKGAKILGITGDNRIKNYTLLRDMGYNNMSGLVGVYLILVRADTPDAQINELRDIFVQAEQAPRVQELYRSDYSFKQPGLRTAEDYQRWYQTMIRYYRDITAGYQIE